MKLTFPQQLTVKDSYAKFHENPTKGLVTDTRSLNDRSTDVVSTHGFLFLICKESLRRVYGVLPYVLDDRGIVVQFFTKMSTLTLQPIQPTIQCTTGFFPWW